MTATHRSTTPAIAVAAILIAVGLAGAQTVSPVCRETCPTCDVPAAPSCAAALAECTVRIENCQTKLDLFNGYIAQMRAGVPLLPLTASYLDVLDPLFSAPLSRWRFGFSDRQPPNNATTPCDATFFNDRTIVMQLAGGSLDRNWRWLFHEIAHFEQCVQVGGYDVFAKMWWDHLSIAALRTSDLGQIHDMMPMEQDADSRANQVFDQFQACCLDPVTNHLIRPLEVTPIEASSATITIGFPVELAVQTTGGPTQWTGNWLIRPPGATSYEPPQNVGEGSVTGTTFSWTPRRSGEYSVLYHADLPSPLTDHRDEQRFFVREPWDGTVGDPHPELTRLLRDIRGLEVVQHLGPGMTPGTVCLSCPRDIATQRIRDAIEGARIRSEVSVTIRNVGDVVADLGRHRPSGGSFPTLGATTTVRPQDRFQDPADGCGYTIAVADSRGAVLAEAPVCLDLR